jgi:hypothetical protein
MNRGAGEYRQRLSDAFTARLRGGFIFQRKKADQSGHKEPEEKPGGHRRENGPETEDVIFDDTHFMFPFNSGYYACLAVFFLFLLMK